ncbi:LOW QUALITY PROTEIN: L-dopachrome tautomerase yellow-f-like [Galleria mellonella]|uniref:LOW QUALITY PROTEIN: L-dopachrome tautomerase yellow-f-like n=1 Tax=Galleria mellonella TaxID=7137 RepID=A0ABM3MWQ8_GALME|nr:LOW QUALITY PROTEIN: L-dopachrome tautomerase yellow-f-like [Galleria mellonella]
MKTIFLAVFICLFQNSSCFLPPKFQWKVIDFTWANQSRKAAIDSGLYVAENNMPTGLARRREKVFVTIPRWKRGVPSSLNYIYVNGSQQQPLNPYPSWADAVLSDKDGGISSNSTVVSTFRVHADRCDRLWVVDNGVTDMSMDVKQVADPAIVIFDLNTDKLLHRYIMGHDVLRESSVLTSIVVDIGKNCSDAFAYIPDMGSNAIIVYSLRTNEAWRVDHHYFHFDPHAGTYKVGGVHFYWSDGVSSVALSQTRKDGYRDLYFHPTSSTKQFKMSTKLLKNKNVPSEDIFNGVAVVGDRGANSQATACDFDHQSKILFYTQLCKNGVGCWNTEKLFTAENNPVIISDCNLLEFPNDVKVDQEGNIWILSNRQSRFLYESMDFDQVNFRILTAPVSAVVQGTPCERTTVFGKALSFVKRNKSGSKQSLTN